MSGPPSPLSADVVVVGAGLGGLAAAASVARTGRSVVVLEHHAVPGGYAHDFRRGHYRFEVSLHAIDGVAPGGLSYPSLHALGVLDRVHFHRLDPLYIAEFPGRRVVAHADPLAYEAELIRHFPGQRVGIRSLTDELSQVYREVLRLEHDLSAGTLRTGEAQRHFPHALRAMNESWSSFMGRHIDDPELMAVFSATWGYFGLPPSVLNAAAFALPWVSYHHFGSYYPDGGSTAISRALEAEILAHGGKVLYRQRVERIHVEGGRVVGVRTQRGLEVSAQAVISNANAPDTVQRLVGASTLPRLYVDHVVDTPDSISCATLYIGLERDAGRADNAVHETLVFPSYDLDRQYESALAGDFAASHIALLNYSVLDPGCAPDGGSVLAVSALASWDHRDVWGTGGSLDDYRKNPRYLAIKNEVTAALYGHVERFHPGAREATRYAELSTPLTHARYSLNRRGAIYGFEQSVRTMYSNRPRARTPISNLFLAGAWTRRGGGQNPAIRSGIEAAELATQQLTEQWSPAA